MFYAHYIHCVFTLSLGGACINYIKILHCTKWWWFSITILCIIHLHLHAVWVDWIICKHLVPWMLIWLLAYWPIDERVSVRARTSQIERHCQTKNIYKVTFLYWKENFLDDRKQLFAMHLPSWIPFKCHKIHAKQKVLMHTRACL